jgi:colanic acid/amylovoran biosynthesis glycosyltransferase
VTQSQISIFLDSSRRPLKNLTIAYLAPEIPALSATFVYEELLALERCGFNVIPVSVRRPSTVAEGQESLATRTYILYDSSRFVIPFQGLLGMFSHGTRLLQALKWLVSDMAEVGYLRSTSWKLAYQFLAAVKLASLLRANGCEHLHVHFAHVPTQIAMYASALSGIPFTIMAHANDIFERGLLLQRKSERAKRLLTISLHNQRFLQGLGISRCRLAIVRCGVSFAIETKRQHRSLDGRPFRIGTLGRMVEKKGFDVLIRALALLKVSGRSVELQIAGDGPLKNELDNLGQTLRVAELVCFQGELPHHQVATWMRDLDVFVLACKQDRNGDMDGIPVVLMEAMSQSVPVISTRLSGIPELVIHDDTGLLARPNDHEDLARQIDRLIESPRLAEAISRRGCEHVVAEFGQANNIERLIGYFGLVTRPTPFGEGLS